MTIYTCSRCGSVSDYWSSNCPDCNAYAAMLAPGELPRSKDRPSKSLADAKPLSGVRISTGVAGLDRVLGTSWRTGAQGIHIPSQVLLAGSAGSGKSTLLMRVAARVATPNFLYLSTEQTLEEIRDNA